MTLGYNKPLYILPFDHRGSFQTGMFGWKGSLSPAQTAQIAAAKQVIYDGFKAAVTAGVAKERAGILVEYGDDFARHIETFNLTFCKVLVRYNPEADKDMNARQTRRLRQLSEYLHHTDHKFMFELLVPATPEQLQQVGGDHKRYDLERRPALMVGAIRALQEAGIEPDIWKIEGLDRREDCVQVVETARRDGRDDVGCIVLGRGEDEAHVHTWLTTAAGVPGFIGFAVGRTTFWDPLIAWREQRSSREAAAAEIARRYRQWVDVFAKAHAS
jgi:myo-inositol catabolism protein IolC